MAPLNARRSYVSLCIRPWAGCQKNYMFVEWRMSFGHLAAIDRAPWRLCPQLAAPTRITVAQADWFLQGDEGNDKRFKSLVTILRDEMASVNG
jgi:hypothetical protein